METTSEKAYFLDTYALIEIINRNGNYGPYKKGNLITTRLNLMELHYFLLRTASKENANFHYNFLLSLVVEISDEVIKKSNEFRLLIKKRKLSYVDCIGYTIAKINNVKFLTGDNQFKDLENVEFVN